MDLNTEQAEALQFVSAGDNLLITVGKSRLVTSILKDCEARNLKVAMVWHLIHDKMYIPLPVESHVVSIALGSNGPIRVQDGHEHIRKAKRVNFKQNFAFFMSLLTTEAHVCGLKFIWLYGT